jgi:hypothetical protein
LNALSIARSWQQEDEMLVRRVVVGTNEDGRSVVLSDGPAPHTHDFASLPGQSQTRIWRTPGVPSTTPPSEEPTTDTGPALPGAGGASFLIVQFAPDEVAQAPGFDGAAVGAEFATWASDIAASTDPDEPSLHRTRTLDFAVVLDGEVWLEVDDGVQTRLAAGDTVVQIAGRHGWHNKTSRPATVAVVLTDAAD